MSLVTPTPPARAGVTPFEEFPFPPGAPAPPPPPSPGAEVAPPS